MSARLIGVLVLIAAASAPASAAELHSSPRPRAAETQADALEHLRQAYAHAQRKDLAAAAASLDDAMRAPSFPRLPEDIRYKTVALAAQVAKERGLNDDAHRLYVRASELPSAEADAWHGRLATAFDGADFADAARCITTIAQRWPKTLADLNDYAVLRIAQELAGQPAHASARHDMIGSLFDAGWATQNGEPEELWIELIRHRLARGDLRKAADVLGHVHSPRSVVELRADARFDRLARADPRAFDLARAIEASVKEAEARVRATPDRLLPVVLLQNVLNDALQFERALKLADGIVAATRNGEEPGRYADFDEQYVWVLDGRAESLRGLGRWEDALKQRERAARRPEHGGMNVSQAINLGSLYLELARPADALEAVAELGPMTPFGRMQYEGVRFDAAVQSGDADAASRSMAYLRAHREDAIDTWQTILLVAGDAGDAAAKLLIERLGREDWRGGALVAMQEYAQTPATPLMARRRAQWKALIARPDVQAVLAKVGRIERVELAPPRS